MSVRATIVRNLCIGNSRRPQPSDFRTLASAPGLSEAQRALAAERLRVVREAVTYFEVRALAVSAWRHAPPRERKARRPRSGSLTRIHALLMERSSLRFSARTLRKWVLAFVEHGPLGLVSKRGKHSRPRAELPADAVAELLNRLARGDSIAAAWRLMAGEWRGVVAHWPALRTVQQRFGHLVQRARRTGKRSQGRGTHA